MGVPITTLLGSDNVALSRLTLNQNFSALASVSDAVTTLLDPTLFTLTGVKSVSIDDAAQPFTASILNVGKGGSILGNFIAGTGASATSTELRGTGGVLIPQGSLNITLGNLVIDAVTSLLDAQGHLSVGQEFRMQGVSTAFTNTTGLTNTGATTSISTVAGLKFLVVSNEGATATPTSMLLPTGTAGQVLEIYHTVGASPGGGPVHIDITNWAGLTVSPILLTETGDRVKAIYDASSWYLWDFTSASDIGASSSVYFERS